MDEALNQKIFLHERNLLGLLNQNKNDSRPNDLSFKDNVR